MAGPHTRHGYTRPEPVDEAGGAASFDAAMERSAALYDVLLGDFPAQAPYAVCLAYRVRFVMQLNAREAMHLIELRTAPAGPSRLPADRARRCTDSSPSRPAIGPSPRRCPT